MRNRPETLERLLEASADGDSEAFGELVSRLYDELRRAARAQLRRGRPDGLETTVLVHEAYL
ncbi:MAG: ECF-type sigma factor, partial [Chloroflexi bacterium]|nr:ECF-type sigma factor [Chloroflexota bacterium]